jgi:hypothetical protein
MPHTEMLILAKNIEDGFGVKLKSINKLAVLQRRDY